MLILDAASFTFLEKCLAGAKFSGKPQPRLLRSIPRLT